MSKKIKFLIVAIFLSVFLHSCLTTALVPHSVTSTTDKWAMYEVLPSKAQNSTQNSTVFSTTLADGSRLTVYRDFNIPSIDMQLVYSRIMQDFGWRSSGDKWVQASSSHTPRRTVVGNMYVKPSRRMAIYFYPDETYGVFGVRIEK
jgi:hypothetical protein